MGNYELELLILFVVINVLILVTIIWYFQSEVKRVKRLRVNGHLTLLFCPNCELTRIIHNNDPIECRMCGYNGK